MKKLARLLLLLLAPAAFAQQGTTSEISGRVTSAGQLLAGVTITITSERMQGTRVVMSGANGAFLVGFLSPGDYELVFQLRTFTPARRRVRVALGATTKVEAELQLETIRETIDIEPGNRPLLTDTSIGTQFASDEIDRLPVGRDLRSMVLLSPSVSTGAALMIAGAPSWDSLFLADGIVINEYQTGQPHPVLFEDAIEEVVVLSGAIPAEYGRFTGGVVSTVTKSGGDEFHGSLRGRFTNSSWQAQTAWRGATAASNEINPALEGTLGGFVLRERVWFFFAGRDARRSVRRFTALTNAPYDSETTERRAQAKLTARISPRHSVIGSIVTNSIAETNVVHPRIAEGRTLDVNALIPERKRPMRLLALTSTVLHPSQWFSEIHYSTGTAALRGNGGRSRDRLFGTTVNIRGAGATAHAPFGCGICGDDRRDHDAVSAKASHYRNTRLGNHTFVIGADAFRETRRNRGTRSASEYTVQSGAARVIGDQAYPLFGPGTLIFWTPYYEGESGSDLGTAAVFMNDRWEITPRLMLSLGMRYDRNRARDALRRVISDDAETSPRVSAALDVRGDGRHRLFAGYGRYAARLLEGGGAPTQVGIFNNFAWRYRGPEINSLSAPTDQLLSTTEALRRLFEWFDAVGGLNNRQFLTVVTGPESAGDFDGSLRSPAVDEWSLGYLFPLPSGAVRADLVARDWNNFYALRIDKTTGQRVNAFGNVIDVARIINDDEGSVRSYRALQVQGRWHRGPLTAGGGYTLSTLRGNDDGEDGVGSHAPRNLPLALWYPEYFGYQQRRAIGYLSQDQRHRARGWLTWRGNAKRNLFSFSLLQTFDSGKAYSAVAEIDATGRAAPFPGMPENPGYALNQAPATPYFFSKRGGFRTGDVWSTDLSLGWELAGHVSPLVRIEVFNLLNRAAVVSPGREVLTRQSAGATSGLGAFNPFTETPVEGVHYVRTTSFGKPTGPDSYQPSRRFEVSVGVRF